MPRRRHALCVAVVVLLTGCAAEVPAGKAWTVDTSAWEGSPQCVARGCALDAYETRDFVPDAVLPGVLADGASVQVHCFVPTPAPQQDPDGREAYRWYLLTVDGEQVWAPDLALTADADLRHKPSDVGTRLADGLSLCHSAVPGR
jgi:hypothetical protein